MTQKCEGFCGRRYNILTKGKLCYYCYTKKHGNAPTSELFDAGEWNKPMHPGGKGKKGK